jgi:hypothetical protein
MRQGEVTSMPMPRSNENARTRMAQSITIAILLIGLTGCTRTLNYVLEERAKGEGTSKTYSVDAEQAWRISKQIFRWAGADAIEEHRAEGYMLATSPERPFQPAGVMGAWVESMNQHQTKVTVIVRRRLSTYLSTPLSEETFHTWFAGSIDLVQAGQPLPPTPPGMGVSVPGASPQTAQTEHESLHFEVEEQTGSLPRWKIGYQAELPDHTIIEMIREGDDINNWKELLTIQNFRPSWGGAFPEDTLNILKAIRERDCQGVTRWSTIGKDEQSIVYEWQARPCRGWPDQHEIARIIYGKYNRVLLRYTVKVYEMPPEERTKWIGIFLQAKLNTSLR